MAINKEKYIKKYIDEGLEIIANVENIVFDIKKEVSSEGDLATLLRSLHTLKGTSRMLEFKRIEELTHSLESVFVSMRDKNMGFSENSFKIILSSLDILKSGITGLHQTNNDSIEVSEYVKKLSFIAENIDYDNPKSANKNETAAAAYSGLDRRRESNTETIRISLDKIDNIIKNIASLQTLETTSKAIFNDVKALNSMIRQYSKTIKEFKKADVLLLSDSRKLERMCARLNLSLKNYVIDTGNSIRTAYESVISLRTLPLSTIFDNYPRYVYQLSEELGKKIHLTIEGNENEIDRNIIESISEVFMHMIRNSIDHGLETPQERLSVGKSETGNIFITCSRESGSMKIVISDDGRGINIEKIRQKAVKNGLIAKDSAESLTNEELIKYIFHSGFSTSGDVSNVSGRGVGMDVVQKGIEALKGSIVVDTFQGEGTAFTIMIPLSISTIMGFPIESGGMKFIIPGNFVDNILLLNKDEIISESDIPEIDYDDRRIKLFYLKTILNIRSDTVKNNENVFILIIRSYEDITALAVDNIDSMRSVILKTMPSFMEKIPVFSGIVLNDDYEMLSVLHIPTVIQMAKNDLHRGYDE